MTLDQIRIHVPLDPADEQGLESEALAAERISAEEFRLLASPLFAYDLSRNDIVLADKKTLDPADPESDIFEFREVRTRGGHSTYRVYLQNRLSTTDAEFEAAWQPIANLGATFEHVNNQFFAADLPPGADIAAIYDLLEQGEAAGLWEFEEAHYEPPPGNDSPAPTSVIE